MYIKDGTDLRGLNLAAVKQGTDLRLVEMIACKDGTDLRVVWRRKTNDTGWVFTQGHPISVSGRFIRLNGQQ